MTGELTWDPEEVHLDDPSPSPPVPWKEGETRVVSGPIGTFLFPGRPFPNRDAARAFWSERADIVEEYFVEGRWVFRIKAGPLRAPLPPFEDNMRMKIDTKAFVRAWTDSSSVDEVAEKMGMKRTAAMTYASKLRNLGVNLKNFRTAQLGPEVDVAALNALIGAP